MGKKSDQKTQSLRQLFSLLSEVRSNPEVAREVVDLTEALSSQGKLSHLSVESRQIVPMSLNTFKRVADLCLPDGFSALDQLRLDCIRAMARGTDSISSPARDTRESLRIKAQQEHVKNQRLREDLMFITDRLLAALNLAERCAEAGNDNIRALFRRERAEILVSLGLRSCGTQARKEYERHRQGTA